MVFYRHITLNNMTALLQSEGRWLLLMYLSRCKKVNVNLSSEEDENVGRPGLWIQFHDCEEKQHH